MKHKLALFVALILVSIPQSALAYGYIEWTGSINGIWVTDASGDMVRFTTEGYMMFGTTLYTNVYIDSNANLYIDGSRMGSVAYVVSTTGSKMTAIVDDDGFLIDIYGSQDYMTIDRSSVPAVFW